MVIHGQFYDVKNNLIDVTINNTTVTGEQLEIGRESGVLFGAEPVTIETDNEDTFNHIIRKSATINLITTTYKGNIFFANNARSVSVTITRNNTCIFYGFLEPNTYEQPYTKPLDEFSLNCVDALSTLQYYKYMGVTLNNFDTKKTDATQRTFLNILIPNILSSEIMQGAVYYDLSKGVSSARTSYIFNDLAINESYIIGKDYEDTWTQEEVLEEILKYMNLHIIQNGYNFFIFDWDTLKQNKTLWRNIVSGSSVTIYSSLVTMTNAMHASDDTNITISEVYNQISVKDELEAQDTLVTSPLEKSDLTSLWRGKQLYMSEFIAEGSGDNAHDAMINMVNGRATTYKNAKQVDWFIQALNNKNWKLMYNGEDSIDELGEQDQDGKYKNQWKLAKYLKEHTCVPCIFKLGKIETKGGTVTDNSPVSKIDMKPYLYISINGNQIDLENSQYPNDNDIDGQKPIIEYVGDSSGGVFSPVDDDTINYIVFTGKILLQPITYESGKTYVSTTNNYETIRTQGMRKSEGAHAAVPHYGYIDDPTDLIFVESLNNLVKSDNNSEGRYYTRKFYTTEYVKDEPTTYLTDGSAGIQPWTDDKCDKGYQYKYSKKWNSEDTYTKLPLIECELIIGNKRLIETNIDEKGNSTFQWVPLGQEPTQTVDGVTYTLTTFSLGVNPKIEDYIIGQEYDIQNTVSYTMNLDVEGTAIPITKDDALSGAVIFRILGPVNTIWKEITKSTHRHFLFWRHTTWATNNRFILSHCENIIIKEFECKLYCDNGQNAVNEQNDLIYMSDETDQFVNKKDDIEFKFITQLSSQECLEKGIENTININAVIDARTNTPLTSIYNANTQETAKAEEHYVDNYYREYCTPRIQMSATVHNSNDIKFNNTFHSIPLNKNFFVQAISENIRNNTSTIKIKEI